METLKDYWIQSMDSHENEKILGAKDLGEDLYFHGTHFQKSHQVFIKKSSGKNNNKKNKIKI